VREQTILVQRALSLGEQDDTKTRHHRTVRLLAPARRPRRVARRGTEERATAYTVRIEWDSADGHLRGFRGSPQFAGFFAAVRPYVDRIEEMRHYEVKSAGPS
jgi:hemoglobin